MIIFIVVSILLLPFAYIFRTIKLFLKVFELKLKFKSRILALVDAIIHLIFGIIIYLIIVVCDIIIFAKSCFNMNIKLRSDFSNKVLTKSLSRNIKIDPEFYTLFIELLKLQKDKIIPAKRLIMKDLSRALRIYDQVHRMLFQIKTLKHAPSLNL